MRLAALLLAVLLPGTALAEPAIHPHVRGFAPVNGIALFYEIYGAGPPLLLIHGGLSNHRVWRGEIERLAENHTVILADSRGQGRSSRTAEPITYDLMAADYLKLLDVLNVASVSLVGWSDGGIIGLDIAIHHPERLDALFVQAANATPDGALSNLSAARRGIEPPPLRHYDDVGEEIEALWANEPNFTAEELASIRVPTQIAIGAHDEAISLSHTIALAAAIPGARLTILPGVGHSAPLEDPDGYASAVLAFLDEEAAGTSASQAPRATLLP